MKKIITVILMLLLVSACSNEGALNQEKTKVYQAFWNAILNQDRFVVIPENATIYQATNFTIETRIEDGEEEGKYEYTMIMNNPRRALYDINILVLDVDTDFSTDMDMKPSAGIWEDITYNMIPSQSNNERGFFKGISLSGETDNDYVTLRILIEWHDVTLMESHREFFEVSLRKPVPVDETITEEAPAEEAEGE